MRFHKVKLELPKFELEFSSDLNGFLNKLGMVEPFRQSADFSEMKKENDIYISQVIQKTYLKVDEKGTEAAAVTAIRVTKSISTHIIPIIYKKSRQYLLKVSKFFVA